MDKVKSNKTKSLSVSKAKSKSVTQFEKRTNSASVKSGLRGRDKKARNETTIKSIEFQEIDKFNDVPRFNSTAQALGKRSAPSKS